VLADLPSRTKWLVIYDDLPHNPMDAIIYSYPIDKRLIDNGLACWWWLVAGYRLLFFLLIRSDCVRGCPGDPCATGRAGRAAVSEDLIESGGCRVGKGVREARLGLGQVHARRRWGRHWNSSLEVGAREGGPGRRRLRPADVGVAGRSPCDWMLAGAGSVWGRLVVALRNARS